MSLKPSIIGLLIVTLVGAGCLGGGGGGGNSGGNGDNTVPAIAGAGTLGTHPGPTVLIEPEVSDADSDSLSFTWSLLQGPPINGQAVSEDHEGRVDRNHV